MHSNITLDDVYNETITRITQIFVYFAWFTHLFLLPFGIYLVLFKSKGMQAYRFYALNIILWNILTEFVFILLQPVFLSPLPIALLTGPIAEFATTHRNFLWFCVDLEFFSLGNFAISVLAAASLRLAVLLNYKIFIRLFTEPKIVAFWLLCIEVGFIGGIYMVFEHNRGDFTSENTTQKLVGVLPFLGLLTQRHTLYGMIILYA